MRQRLWSHAIVIAALLLIVLVSRVDAGDETCYPIEVTWYSPSGIAGCTIDGPTDGIASTYDGDAAAVNWCVHPWTDCGSVVVQSHLTGLTIEVPVGMYCDCWWTTDRRLVDLTPGQVAALGLDPANGLFEVTVTPIDPAGGSRWDESPAGGGASGPVIPPAGLPDTALPPGGVR